MSVTVERLVAEVRADTARARRELDRLDVRMEAVARDREAKIHIEPDLNQAKFRGAVTLGVAAATKGITADIPVKVDVDRSGFDMAQREIVKINRNLSNFGRNVGAQSVKLAGFQGAVVTLTGAFKGLGLVMGVLKIPVMIAAAPLLATGIMTLVGSLTALASTLGPVLGLLFALPGALMGAVGVLGAAVLGFSGLTEAVGAYMQAEKQSAVSGATAIQQARAKVSAYRSLIHAQEALADAEKNLAEAQKPADALTMREAELDLRQARLSHADAVERLTKAQQAYNRSQSEFVTDEFTGKTYEIVRITQDDANDQLQAALDVEQAKIGIERAEERINELRKIGTAEDENLLAAQRAVRDATWGLEEAQQAYNDALKGGVGGANAVQMAINEATKDLSASGRAFAQYIASLRPKFIELRNAVQDAMLPDVQSGLSRIIDAQFGNLMTGLPALGSVFGDFFDQLGTMLSSQEWVDALAHGFDVMERYATILGPAVLDLIDGMRLLLQTAEPLSDWFVGKLAEWAAAFRNWAADDDGSLRGYFDDVIYYSERWFDILGLTWEVLKNIGRAALPSGDSMLGGMTETLERWADWTGSNEGQQAMSQWFQEMRDNLTPITTLLSTIGMGLLEVGRSEAFGSVVDQISQQVVPALVDLFTSVDPAFMKTLMSALAEFIELLGRFGGLSEALNIFVGTLSALFSAINWLTGSNAAVSSLVASLATLAGLRFIFRSTGLQALFGGVMNLSRGLRGLEGATGIGGAIGRGFRGLGPSISRASSALGNLGRAVGSGLLTGITRLGTGLRTLATGAIPAVRLAASSLFTFLMAHPFVAIGVAVAGLAILVVKNWDTIKEWTIRIWNAVWEFIRDVWDWIWDKIDGVVLALWDFFKSWTLPGLIISHWDTIWTAVRDVWDWIWQKVQDVGRLLYSYFMNFTPIGLLITHWDTLKTTVGEVWDWIWTKINTVAGWITGAASTIRGALSGIWNGLTDGFVGIINWILRGFFGLVNGIIDAWNALDIGISFTIPSWIPIFGGKGWSVDDLIPDVSRIGVPQIDLGGRPNAVAQPGRGGQGSYFHAGGIYRTPDGAPAGMAWLRDGERVLSVGETARYDSGTGRSTTTPDRGVTITNVFNEKVDPMLVSRQLVWSLK